MAKIMDGQVRHLFRLLEARESLSAAALKTGMDRNWRRWRVRPWWTMLCGRC